MAEIILIAVISSAVSSAVLLFFVNIERSKQMKEDRDIWSAYRAEDARREDEVAQRVIETSAETLKARNKDRPGMLH